MNKFRFDSYLNKFNAEQLKTMALLWGGQHYKQTKQQSIDLIQIGLGTPSKVKEAIARLQPFERVALEIAKQDGNPIRGRALLLKLHLLGIELPKKEHRYTNRVEPFIQDLLDRGLFMPVDMANRYYYSPSQLDNLFFTDERLLAQAGEITPEPLPITPTSGSAPSIYRRPSAVVLDLINVLQAVDVVSEFPLTKAGTVRVSSLRKLRKQLGLKSDDVEIDGLRFNNLPEAMVYALFHAGILIETNKVITMAETVDVFFARPPETQINQLLSGFIQANEWLESELNVYSYGVEKLSDGRSFLKTGLAALPVDASGFFAFDEFEQALYERVGEHFSFGYIQHAPHYFRGNEDEIAEREKQRKQKIRENWLKQEYPWIIRACSTWLYYLGIVELQLKENTPVGLRLTDLGRTLLHPGLAPLSKPDTVETSGPTWVIQPNFDMVVYLDRATPEQMVFLERHAEREQVQQHMAQYRLTQSSVYKGLEDGTSIETLLETLKMGASKDLPQNVTIDLQEWAKLRERMTLRHQTHLLEFPDSAAREKALQANVKGIAIGARFLLVTHQRSAKIVNAKVIDYNQPLPRCLSANEDGLIKVSEGHHDFLLEAQLGKWAERKEERVWQITQETVTQALLGKVKIEDLFALLEERLIISRLPALLEVALSAWGRKRTELELANVTIIYCSDSKVFRAISKSRKLKPYIKGTLGSNLLLVDPNQVDALRTQLKWAGIKVLDELTGKKKRS